MPGVLEARYSQSATEENKQREEKGISSLPDDIVFRILRRVILGPVDVQLRTSLPLVCKKWREILYLQGGHHLFRPETLVAAAILVL